MQVALLPEQDANSNLDVCVWRGFSFLCFWSFLPVEVRKRGGG